MKISSVDDCKRVLEDAKTEVALYRNPDVPVLIESLEWILEDYDNLTLERDDLNDKLGGEFDKYDELESKLLGMYDKYSALESELEDAQLTVHKLEQEILALEAGR